MKKEELQEFKQLLIKRARGLLKDIDGYEADIKEIEGRRSLDWIDKVADEAPIEVLEILGGRQRQEIAQIEEALERIEDGSYGKCVNCGRDISTRRLRAIPFALQCIECKRGEEI